MATLAAARTFPDETRSFQRQPAPAIVSSAPEPIVRAGYQPSRRSGPIAGLASAGVILAAMAALATLNVAAEKKRSIHLTVVQAKELDVTPPPPPPPQQRLEEPVEQAAPMFIPKTMIALPAPGPTQVALDVPPPPTAPAVAATPKVAVPTGAAAAAPAPSSDPVEGGDLSSQVLSAKPPPYPVDARRRREQGTVKLLVLVGPDGRVSDIELASSSGSQALDRAALGAVKRWRWAPQKKGGEPVAVRGYVTIPFVLTT